MQTLDEWNEKAGKEWLEGRKVGVLCPECKEEMVRSPVLISVETMTYEEKPPTQDVLCPNCNYKGRMILRKEKIEKIEIPRFKFEPPYIGARDQIPFLETVAKKINEIIGKRY